jgi:hypothetical protein
MRPPEHLTLVSVDFYLIGRDELIVTFPDIPLFTAALFKNRSVPKHGAKNILPLAARFTVFAAMRSHITTQIPVKICRIVNSQF